MEKAGLSFSWDSESQQEQFWCYYPGGGGSAVLEGQGQKGLDSNPSVHDALAV